MNDKKPIPEEGGKGGATPSITALLAKEDEEFVSLHELLTAIAERCACTYQDAARYLLRRLDNTPDEYSPSWCRLDRALGIRGIDWNDARNCLTQAAESGEPEP